MPEQVNDTAKCYFGLPFFRFESVSFIFAPVIKIGHIELPDMPLLLAPMEDVSDPPFRHLCKKYGADMLYTEFISADGLIRDAQKSMKKLDIYDDERPVGIQIFGGDEEAMMRSAEIVEAAKPELLDINYGCPVKNVVCRNAGAGILRDIDKMVSLTASIVRSTKLPVTLKTRLGWDDNSIRLVEVAGRLQDVGLKAISIHCRTKHQLYNGKANWEWLGKVKENPRLKIPVFHMEAGNRCFDQNAPEEINRKIVDHISDINLPYTEHSRRYLLSEGFRKEHIFVTGSPMSEVLHRYTEKIENSSILHDLHLAADHSQVVSATQAENIDNETHFLSLMNAIKDRKSVV
mgnify:CR=1 FL=1